MPVAEQELNEIEAAVADPTTDLLGKECLTCRRVLAYRFYRKDHTFRDGRRDRCQSCEDSPRMSMNEHTAKLKETNNNSQAVESQRWAHQDDYKDDSVRIGRTMHSTDLLYKLRKLLPCLYVAEGGIVGDLSVFRTFGTRQPNGKDFEYLWYVPSGNLPEYSLYEFDTERDVPIREKQRGWRTPLLRLIKAGLLTEGICDAVFGPAIGPGSKVWHRELWNHRNKA